MNSVIIAELTSRTQRENKDVNTAFNAVTALSKMIDISDPDFSKEVGILHSELKQKIKGFGLANAFNLACARKVGAKLLTGDPHFRNMKEAVMI